MAKKKTTKKAAPKKKAPAKKAPAKKAPAKKAAKKDDRSHFIAKAPVRRLMKQEGASLVSQDALMLMIEKLEEQAEAVTKKALKYVKDEGRKRVTPADIGWAIR